MDIRSWASIKDEVFGKIGTAKRDNLEKEVAIFISKLKEKEKEKEKRADRGLSFARFYYLGSKWRYNMTELVIDKKKYVLIPEKNFRELKQIAAKKWRPEKTFTIEEARAYSKKKINEWASEK